MTRAKVSEKRSSTRILMGLIVGTLIGVVFHAMGFRESAVLEGIVSNVTDPLGQIFLNGLKLLVVPLVLSSLIGGVSRLGSLKRLGNIGGKLAVFYIATSLVAAVMGQALVSFMEPGAGLPSEMVEQAQQEYEEQMSTLLAKSEGVKKSLWPGILNTLVPTNILTAMSQPSPNMLAIIVFSIFMGMALLALSKDKALPVQNLATSVEEAVVVLIGWVMRLAPYAVACLMIGVVARFGWDLLEKLAFYMLTVILGYLLHFFGTYQLIVRFVLKYPYSLFLAKMAPVFATAFSTSSSAATMPTTIHTAEKSFGVKRETASFSIPLGTTVNMDGTALFECVAALFVAQVFGVDLSLGSQVSLVLIIVMSSIGVAGVPGGSIPVIMSAMAMFGIPPVGIALVLGVDRLLDMGRTVLNVTGDMCGALYLAKVENQKLSYSESHTENIVQQ